MSAVTDAPRTTASPARRLHLVHGLLAHMPRPRRPLTSERFFQTLDGREIDLGRTRWRVSVYSVYVEEGFRWVQVSLEGARRHILTLKLPLHEDGTRALSLVAAWLTRPMTTGDQILTVA